MIPRPTVLVLNTAVPISPIFPCLTFNAFRKTDYHFDHVDVIQSCFEGLVVLYFWLLCVYNISSKLKIHPYPTVNIIYTAIIREESELTS